MFLKLIILAAAGYFIYTKILGGKTPTFKKSKAEKKLDADTLVECEKCGTYVTLKESILIHGKYYCDECAGEA